MKKILLMAAILILVPATALAQSACGPRSEILKHLFTKYNEVPIAVSVTNKGVLIERFESADKKSWTIVVTHPSNKISCMAYAGEHWKILNTGRTPFNERNL